MIRRCLTTLLLMFVVTSSASLGGQEPSTTTVSVTITDPRDGTEVGRQIVVKGTAKVPESQKVWLVIRRVDFDPFWWVVAMIRPKSGTGQFEVKGTVGEAADVGSDFDVGVITVDETSHRTLLDHFTKTVEEGKFTPIRIPATTSPPRIIKVRKVSHR